MYQFGAYKPFSFTYVMIFALNQSKPTRIGLRCNFPLIHPNAVTIWAGKFIIRAESSPKNICSDTQSFNSTYGIGSVDSTVSWGSQIRSWSEPKSHAAPLHPSFHWGDTRLRQRPDTYWWGEESQSKGFLFTSISWRVGSTSTNYQVILFKF